MILTKDSLEYTAAHAHNQDELVEGIKLQVCTLDRIVKRRMTGMLVVPKGMRKRVKKEEEGDTEEEKRKRKRPRTDDELEYADS